MSSKIKGLDVSIMGREFRVACPDDQEPSLRKAVAYLDKKMCEIRDAGKVTGIERIAIMAALNISHELLACRTSGDFDIGEFRRRMSSMQAAIDAALAEQDEAF